MKLLQNYDSINELKRFLNENNFAMSRRFGQNFLVSPGSRKKILSLLDPGEHEHIWEIGPGLGALTHELVKRTRMLTVFEIDHGFIRYLNEAFGESPHFTLVAGDAVKTWEPWSADHRKPDKIVGNLPYNAASAIISSFIEHEFIPDTMVFTVQKEMGERMTAEPGSKNYSSFSMLCQFRCTIPDRGDLKPGAFYPSPDVVSKIVEMIPHGRYSDVDITLFTAFTHDLFLSRRKKIHNNIKRGKLSRIFLPEQVSAALEYAEIDEDDRGENIDLSRAAAAVRYLQETLSNSG